MKFTGKLIEHNLNSSSEKPIIKNGRKIPRIWILVADGHLARVYKKNNTHFDLIGEGEPQESLIETEINNKTIGRMTSGSGSLAHHKFEPNDTQSKQSELKFAFDISDFLDQIQKKNLFDKIVVIAAPKMLGYLRSSFSKLVKEHIITEVDKDLTKLNDKDFEKALQKIIWF